MRTPLYFVFYNLLIAPLLILLSHLGALFNAKIRQGVMGRYRTLRQFYRAVLPAIQQNYTTTILFHCASMGEFEHIKPVITRLHQVKPEAAIVVMFFSPSGFENVHQFPGVTAFIYAPFEWFPAVFRLFRRIKPGLFVIAKHDVWPNQLWSAALQRIPIFLVNASLGEKSRRARIPYRWFHQAIYQYFAKILAISEEDGQNFRLLAAEKKVVVVGDTKFDQVIQRSEESRRKKLLPQTVVANRPVFVAGSTWPEDEAHLVPAVQQLTRQFPQLLTILCPHEPTPAHLQQLEANLPPLSTIRLSKINQYQGESVILVDSIGVLANLYSYAWVAFVGGSFKGSIHNVLEPAVYGIPVLFGPHFTNSHEAVQLQRLGCGIVVDSTETLINQLHQLLADNSYRESLGNQARQFVETHRGATDRVVEWILKYLKEEKHLPVQPTQS